MLHFIKQKGILKVIAEAYTLSWADDRPLVYLYDRRGVRLAALFPYSGIQPMNGRDDTTEVSPWEVTEKDGGLIVSTTACSSIWKRKIYRFRCLPHRFIYEAAVEGQGELAEVNYFGGYYSAQLRWGAGFQWSGQNFQKGFTPEPNSDEISYFQPGEGAMIDLMGVPLPGKGHWFFTPPPFCYALQGPVKVNKKEAKHLPQHSYRRLPKPEWLGIGVEALPGENQYTEYGYHGRMGAFYLSLAFEGHAEVKGYYCLPSIGFDFGTTEYEALQAHVTALQETELVSWPERRSRPDWWYEPIFCGWGSQSYEAEIVKGKAPDFSRQDLYEKFISALDAHGVNPGIVVLDDKWQASYGDNQVDERKWPDLPGFVRDQHAAGRKVLLWLKAWDPEGVPVEECIHNAQGRPVAVDPTHPRYEARLRASVRRMLSSQGYDADGFKIDFTARIPSGPGICAVGGAWGLELMRLYLEILYDEAKRTKREALVMTHTPHPYLADVVDMIRLNDVNDKKDINAAMTHRARVVRIACPQAIIDTDNWPIPNKKAWRRYLQLQPDLGVPSLYYATHIDATREPLTEVDYRMIRDIWARHRARVAEMLAGQEKADKRPWLERLGMRGMAA